MKNMTNDFRAFAKMRIESGNKILRNHLETCSRLVNCTFKTIQNEVHVCIKQCIQSYMVTEPNNQSTEPLFGILVDEVTDASNMEQLGLGLRYVKGKECNSFITEVFFIKKPVH